MKIGVYGSAAGDISNETKEKAKEIGRQIARKGHCLITGGCYGLPYEAVLGFNEVGGECVAYAPAISFEKYLNKDDILAEKFTKIIYIPKDYPHADNVLVCRKYRNVSSVADVDAVIIICGRIGTMNEFTIAYDLGKKIGILEGSGGITSNAVKVLLKDINKKTGAKIIYKSDPVKLVDELIKL